MRELSIYIHIPFCVRKCFYCDFLSFPVSDVSASTEMICYVNLLKREIIESAAKYREYQVISIFWGGGTPSILPAENVEDIMETLRKCYHVRDDAEISIEVNPGTADVEKLHQYITSGINRISIGLQSADDGELRRIGRIHDYAAFLKTYETARKVGFHNINIDLMAALPGQSVASYERTLHRVTVLEPEHISAYSLILEKGTPLYERQDEYCFPTEDQDREMYAYTKEYLAACGYQRYEISNYAKAGYACRHNQVYWQRGDYVGFGLGAASMVDNVRWSNPAEPEVYRDYVMRLSGSVEIMEEGGEGLTVPERHVLTVSEQMEEFMFLGLRMMCGVGRQTFAQTFGREIGTVYGKALEEMRSQGLLEYVGERIRLTDSGIDVSNYVMAQFLFE